MILILCHLHDAEAAWLYQRLKLLDPAATVLLVSTEELLYARQVRHTLGREPASFTLTLQNGRRIDSHEVTVLVNRLYSLDPVIWQAAGQKQYQYVHQEINALYLSMLHVLPAERLYNAPSAVGLAGRHLSTAEWQLLAVRAGLPIAAGWPPLEAEMPALPEKRVLVINDEILGDLPADVAPEACLQLAQQRGMRLLELHFARQDAGNVFVGATVFAALHQYGDALVHHFLSAATDGHDLGNTERDAAPAPARRVEAYGGAPCGC